MYTILKATFYRNSKPKPDAHSVLSNTPQPEITQAELLPGYSREKEKDNIFLLCGLSGTVTNN